jgi:UDPglucose--hexose-1-phosphate uridylyltransferase
VPRRHGSRFEEAAQHEYESLARLLKALLLRVNRALESPSYNLIVHTSPFSEDTGEFYHWHLELMPRLTKVAGFEWGTGLYINPTSPEEATRVLRDAKV